MITYRCKNNKKRVNIKECEECYLKNKDRYVTRAVCQLHNIDWLNQLKEIENKEIYTEEDINFLKYCSRRKIISYIENDKYSYNKDFVEFRKEISI